MNGYVTKMQIADGLIAEGMGEDAAWAMADQAFRSAPTVHVEFNWSNKWGECYECGLPAAFYITDAPRSSSTKITDEKKRCAVCAANAAAVGEEIARIEAA